MYTDFNHFYCYNKKCTTPFKLKLKILLAAQQQQQQFLINEVSVALVM